MVLIHEGALPNTNGLVAGDVEEWHCAVVTEAIAWDRQDRVWTVLLQVLTPAGVEDIIFQAVIQAYEYVQHVKEWLRPCGTAHDSPRTYVGTWVPLDLEYSSRYLATVGTAVY